MSETSFGSCCTDLNEAKTGLPNTFFGVEENGVLYFTVGYVQTNQGPGWFDQAVIFCPFCGQKIQDKGMSPRLLGTTIVLRRRGAVQ